MTRRPRRYALLGRAADQFAVVTIAVPAVDTHAADSIQAVVRTARSAGLVVMLLVKDRGHVPDIWAHNAHLLTDASQMARTSTLDPGPAPQLTGASPPAPWKP